MTKRPYGTFKGGLDREYFLTLDQNFKDVAADLDEVQQDVNKKANEQKARVDNLIKNNPQPSEIVDIRQDTSGVVHPTAKERIDTEINKVMSDLAHKAEQSYVDQKVQQVADGAPKITVATLTELQSSYPTGSTNNALVTSDGHIYHWNGSSWTDTGVLYQAKGIAFRSVESTNLSINSVTPKEVSFLEETRTNLFNKATVVMNKQLNETGQLVDYVDWCVSEFIEVSPDTTYHYYENGARFARYNGNKEFISRSGYQENPIVTTSGTRFIRIMLPISNLNSQFLSLTDQYTDYGNYEIKIIDPKLKTEIQNIVEQKGSNLNGKKWLAIGDSVTDAQGSGAIKKYDGYIADETGIIVTNNGISGTGYLATSNGTRLDFCQRIDELTGNEGYDYITIFGHINDSGGSFTLGQFGDKTKDTLAGAIYYAIDQLTQKFPNVKIGIITANPTSWSRNGIFYDVSEIIKQTCKYFSVPCLDFFASSGMNPYNTAWKTQWFLDETHPKTECHRDYIAPKIKRFLESL